MNRLTSSTFPFERNEQLINKIHKQTNGTKIKHNFFKKDTQTKHKKIFHLIFDFKPIYFDVVPLQFSLDFQFCSLHHFSTEKANFPNRAD